MKNHICLRCFKDHRWQLLPPLENFWLNMHEFGEGIKG